MVLFYKISKEKIKFIGNQKLIRNQKNFEIKKRKKIQFSNYNNSNFKDIIEEKNEEDDKTGTDKNSCKRMINYYFLINFEIIFICFFFNLIDY